MIKAREVLEIIISRVDTELAIDTLGQVLSLISQSNVSSFEYSKFQFRTFGIEEFLSISSPNSPTSTRYELHMVNGTNLIGQSSPFDFFYTHGNGTTLLQTFCMEHNIKEDDLKALSKLVESLGPTLEEFRCTKITKNDIEFLIEKMQSAIA